MNKIEIDFKNCYGIHSLEHTFDFEDTNVYAIYAPNGLMKTSFTKSFYDLSKGEEPSEPRHSRPPTHSVKIDGIPITKEAIYVLQSGCEVGNPVDAITAILVNPAQKAEYDKLITDLLGLKAKLINALQKISGIKKSNIESTLIKDWDEKDIFAAIQSAANTNSSDNLSMFEYAVIFDCKAQDILNNPSFASNAAEFSRRYDEIFSTFSSLFKKGVFNPAKADSSLIALKNNGYFSNGHRVQLQGESESFDQTQFAEKLAEANARLDSDSSLKQIRSDLAKNAPTQSLTALFENLNPTELEDLFSRLEDPGKFRRSLWAYYVSTTSLVKEFLDEYDNNIDKMREIEEIASASKSQWSSAIRLFNNRFVEMPFLLEVKNFSAVTLGQDIPELIFKFKDDFGETDCSPEEALKTLSQGEKRAVYLLMFIFEVEARKLSGRETLFILDDIADSFDYKNKHAIIQYLHDLTRENNFYQIILTHNFDFFRALGNANVVRSKFAIMANKQDNCIVFKHALGVNNYFVGEIVKKLRGSSCKLCATVPFLRNLIEYTDGPDATDYIALTNVLHWRKASMELSVAGYVELYNRRISRNQEVKPTDTSTLPLVSLIFETAASVCARENHDALCLEDKIALSMACRLRGEQFITFQSRGINGDVNYWIPDKNVYGKELRNFKDLLISNPLPFDSTSDVSTLEKIGIIVCSNIHINSFMYEPILDLTVEHLVSLYEEVTQMCNNRGLLGK